MIIKSKTFKKIQQINIKKFKLVQKKSPMHTKEYGIYLVKYPQQ